jgi:hypothetical protein
VSAAAGLPEGMDGMECSSTSPRAALPDSRTGAAA